MCTFAFGLDCKGLFVAPALGLPTGADKRGWTPEQCVLTLRVLMEGKLYALHAVRTQTSCSFALAHGGSLRACLYVYRGHARLVDLNAMIESLGRRHFRTDWGRRRRRFSLRAVLAAT